MKLKKLNLRLQTRITILVCSVVAVSLFVTDLLISQKVVQNTRNTISEKAIDIGKIVANSSTVIESLDFKKSTNEIQTFTNKISHLTNVEFIVVMDMNTMRKSHPDISKLDKPFVGGDEQEALKGKEYISTAEGTLGKSLRSFTPIYSSDGKQIGVVVVGILLDKVEEAVSKSNQIIYISVAFGLLIGIIGAMLLANNVKNILLGLEPVAIAKLLEERNAILESVREGILAVDKDSNITLVNAQAIKLFNKAGIYENPVGKNAEECIPNTRMLNVLKSGNPELDQEQDLNGIKILANRFPICVNGKIVGAISTFRDKTEIKLLAEQLTGIRLYADALKSQTHEFMNKLHVILGMVHTGYYEELCSYINKITNNYQIEVGFIVKYVRDPVLAGFILGKINTARKLNIELKLNEDSYLPEPLDSEISHKLVTIIGNLIDNSIDALENCKTKMIDLSLYYKDEWLTIEINDTGNGISNEIQDKIFEKGYSTKGLNRGVGLYLIKQNVEDLGGEIELYSKIGEGTKIIIYIHYLVKE